MDEVIYGLAACLLIMSPLFLVVGLVRPNIFRRVFGKDSRKRAVIVALLVFIASVTLAGIFEPESVKQERLASSRAETAERKTETKPKEHTSSAKVFEISSLERTGEGYVVSGRGDPGQTMELQISGKKLKVSVGRDGRYMSQPIREILPYGSMGLYKLEKSFLSTKAHEKQIKYYSLFANKPRLSTSKLPAHITEVKRNSKGFQAQGFYLADKTLEIVHDDQVLGRYTTNKDGFFVFTHLPVKTNTMALAIRSGGSTILERQYVYTPKLQLINSEPRVETSVVTESIPFQSSSQEDSGLTKGVIRIAVAGKNGERTLTHKTTYIDGKLVSSQLVSDVVTVQPIHEVKKIGTYVKPTPSVSSGSGYTNSSGNYVPSPSSNPAGATAKCRDGTYSYSQSRRGTCSHHGGVAVWY